MTFRAQPSQRLHHILLINLCLLERPSPFFRHVVGNLLPTRLVVIVHLPRSIRWWRPKLCAAFGNWHLELVVKIFETLGCHMGQSLMRRPIKYEFAAHHHDNLVEQLYILHRMRSKDNGATTLRDLAEELHDFFLGGGIES